MYFLGTYFDVFLRSNRWFKRFLTSFDWRNHINSMKLVNNKVEITHFEFRMPKNIKSHDLSIRINSEFIKICTCMAVSLLSAQLSHPALQFLSFLNCLSPTSKNLRRAEVLEIGDFISNIYSGLFRAENQRVQFMSNCCNWTQIAPVDWNLINKLLKIDGCN